MVTYNNPPPSYVSARVDHSITPEQQVFSSQSYPRQSDPIYSYQDEPVPDWHIPDENVPLLPSSSHSQESKKRSCLVVLLQLFLAVTTILALRFWIFNPSQIESTRRELELITRTLDERHAALVDFMNRTLKIQEAWTEERRSYEMGRVEWVQNWEEEKQEKENEIRALDAEIVGARKKLYQDRDAMEGERKGWEEERKEWDRERRRQRELEYEKERKEEEKKREEEERRRAGLYWEDLKPLEKCVRFGTKEYTAKLANLPSGYNRLKGCLETEGTIHGIKMVPHHCEEKGQWDGMWGHWIIDFDEPSCKTWWDGYTDSGCTDPGSGIRRIQHRLENLQNGDDWKVMCSSTPVSFNGLYFDYPTSCSIGAFGAVYGYWDIRDPTC